MLGRRFAPLPTLTLRQHSFGCNRGTAPELILREGLRGKEVERDSGRAGSEDGLYHGHVEHHRFSGRRGRRKGHVLACNRRIDGEHLVLK